MPKVWTEDGDVWVSDEEYAAQKAQNTQGEVSSLWASVEAILRQGERPSGQGLREVEARRRNINSILQAHPELRNEPRVQQALGMQVTPEMRAGAGQRDAERARALADPTLNTQPVDLAREAALGKVAAFQPLGTVRKTGWQIKRSGARRHRPAS